MSYSKIFSALLLLSTLVSARAVAAACRPELLPQFDDEAPNSGFNFSLVNLDTNSFPESTTDPVTGEQTSDIKERMTNALNGAMQTWNDSCDGATANRFPTFVPLFDTAMDSGFVSVRYEPQQANPDPCSNNTQARCYAVMETFYSDDGFAEIVVYGAAGAEGQLELTFIEDIDHLTELLAHELGHTLGLDHDNCSGSLMNRDPRGAAGVHRKTCDLLKATHQPRHPLQDLQPDGSGLDPSCALGSYCAADFNPWPTIRTSCGWTIRTVTGTIELEIWNPLLGLFTFITVIERTYTDYQCLPLWADPPPPEGGDLPDPPPISLEHFGGPQLALALPRPEETHSESLYLRGWVSSWTHGIGDVALWIDGQEVDPADLEWGFYSPELCQAGVDPGACDPYSGLSATVDISSLAQGRHALEIAAVDGRFENPFPVYMRRDFMVGNTGGPVAIDDQIGATIDLTIMAGLPVDIEVTANDYDPAGAPIRLTNQGVVVEPEHGTAVRINDQHIRYTPRLDAGPTDTFKYAIRNPANQRDRGRVDVTIIYLIYFP